MKQPTIGILAGMGPRSTAPFIDQVITQCQLQYGAKDDLDFPRMLIMSLPTPFFADRPTDHEAMEAALVEGIEALAGTGVDFIAIACNSAHVYYPRLASAVRVPVLNMVELTLEALPASARRVAVIAARSTIESGLYTDGARSHGLEAVDLDWQPKVDALIESTRFSSSAAFFQQRWAELAREAEARGVDTLILACADLSAIRAHLDTSLTVLDAAECLAHASIERWLRLASFARPSAEVSS